MFARNSSRQESEAPQARNALHENFPVASTLLAPHVRPQVMAFYRFARAADDVADDPGLEPAEKLRRLDAFEAGLDGRGDVFVALGLRACIGQDTAGLRHAADLLMAFRMDARGTQYPGWNDLCAYCAASAIPVGRFLLDAHGEPDAATEPCDALCTALQILNHLQDISADMSRLGRVYLPQDWLDTQGVGRADLTRAAATPALRRVIDQALDGCDDLLARAAALPDALRDPGLRAQARATLWLAQALAEALRHGDPLATRVAPSRAQVASAVARAALWRLSGR